MDRFLRQSSRAAGIDEGLALFFEFAPSGSARRVDRDHQKGVFSAHGRAGDRERLNSARIAKARRNDMQGVWTHAQLKARKRWVDIDTRVGSIPALLPPGEPQGYMPRSSPTLGERTIASLRELRYDDPSIARLRTQRAV